MFTESITEGLSFTYDIRELDGRLLRIRVTEVTEDNVGAA